MLGWYSDGNPGFRGPEKNLWKSSKWIKHQKYAQRNSVQNDVLSSYASFSSASLVKQTLIGITSQHRDFASWGARNRKQEWFTKLYLNSAFGVNAENSVQGRAEHSVWPGRTQPGKGEARTQPKHTLSEHLNAEHRAPEHSVWAILRCGVSRSFVNTVLACASGEIEEVGWRKVDRSRHRQIDRHRDK